MNTTATPTDRDLTVLRRRARQSAIAASIAGPPARLLEHMVTASIDEPPLPAWGPGEYYLASWPTAAAALGHEPPRGPQRYEWMHPDDREKVERARRNARQVVERHTAALLASGLITRLTAHRGRIPATYRLNIIGG